MPMGFFRTVGSFFNSRILAEETIRLQEEMYALSMKNYPDLSPHEHLAKVWLSRMATFGRNPNDPDEIKAAFAVTMKFACIPSPKCIRALALFILYKENEKTISDNPEFESEFNSLMGPVMEAQENGTYENLYLRYNPKNYT